MRAVAVITILLLALPAHATEDLGDGRCRQDDGQVGVWNGTTADDDGCVTPAEYEQMFSAENLLAVGVIESYQVNEDGTTTIRYPSGITVDIVSNPLDRPVAATPALEPDAPTVRQVLFSWVWPE